MCAEYDRLALLPTGTVTSCVIESVWAQPRPPSQALHVPVWAGWGSGWTAPHWAMTPDVADQRVSPNSKPGLLSRLMPAEGDEVTPQVATPGGTAIAEN